MKKKDEWTRKRTKREERRKKDRGIVDILKIVKHFFSELPEWIKEMEDPRNQSYITYTQEDLIYMGILKNICSVESMRKMEDMFNEDTCIQTLSLFSGHRGLEEMPHSDTLNYYLEKQSPEHLSQLREKMVKKLLKGKTFHKARLLGKYWRIILDGTGIFYFRERHCQNCLKEVRKDNEGKRTVRYYHKVLEAKLVTGKGMVISMGTEFIENEDENVTKQDCEINAAKRLLPKIKKRYPRLPVCVQGDALYEVEPVMEICRENGWEYVFTHKDTRQRISGESYRELEEEDMEKVERIGEEKGKGKYYNGVEKISGKKEKMNMYEYMCKEKGTEEEKKYQYTTSVEITRNNLEELIEAGRGRWYIENEGFNMQKKILYGIEHLNSHDPNAMKNHYLLTQIADIIMQLYLRWNTMVKKYEQGIKNTSSKLLESFRQRTVTDEDVLYIERHTSVYLE